MAERSGALDSSSGVARMWVQIPAWQVAALVSFSKTLNHNCFVLQMGRKGVGPVCCVMHVKEPRTLIVKETRRGLPRCFLIRALSTQQGGYVRATNLIIIIINGCTRCCMSGRTCVSGMESCNTEWGRYFKLSRIEMLQFFTTSVVFY